MEDLLEHPKIWRGYGCEYTRQHNSAALATGFAVLDRYLPGGGWPRDAITEIFLDRYGNGELSLLMPALASLSLQDNGSKQWLVWIDPPFTPYAPALSHGGLNPDRVLLVHSSGAKSNALWAVEQVIRSNSSLAALAWLGSVGTTALRRLQLGAEAQSCWTVLFRPSVALRQRSPAALKLKLERRGAGIRVEIVKCRGRRPAVIDIDQPPWRSC